SHPPSGGSWFFIPSGIRKQAFIKTAYCNCRLNTQDYLAALGDPVVGAVLEKSQASWQAGCFRVSMVAYKTNFDAP
ncbi:MAG: hypothetical protein WBN39_07335, partial [Flavobacteriaceae bacterium]